MFNFKAIGNILGLLIGISGVAMLFALPFSYYFSSGDHAALWISGLGSILFGGLIWLATRQKKQTELRKRDGYLIVTLGWVVMSLIGAFPYLLSGAIPSYTDAFFETISGFTTTGATILGANIEALPEGLHFWRAMTHWIGGMGIIVLTIAILPLLGIGGMQLYAAEVPGPTPDKLTPRIKDTAKRLWVIYVSLTAVEALLLLLGGDMNLFESLCHAMSTLSTGGFSTSQDSMGGFAPYSQYIVIIFMFLAGTNFALTYAALRGKPIRLWQNEEFRVYTYLTLGLIVVVTAILYFFQDYPLEHAFRFGSFEILAIMTTTGFGADDYTAWGPFLKVLFFLLMFSGASAGSTSGGIKVIRTLVVIKNSFLELKRQLYPKAILPVRFNGKGIPPEVVSKILAFFLFFMIWFVIGTVVMAAMGLDIESAMGTVVATLGNVGPGIGIVGPSNVENFALLPDAGKWFLSFLMLLGRLELFTVMLVIMPFYWRES